MPGSPPWRRVAKGAAVAGAVTAGTVLLTRGVAGAIPSDPPDTKTLEGFSIASNILWVVIGAVLVIFMQAGFALVETGFCRAKHAAHVVSTNFAIFGLGFVAFYTVGFALMFGGFTAPAIGLNSAAGGAHANLIGSGNWVFLWKGGFFLQGHSYDVSIMAFFLYMV